MMLVLIVLGVIGIFALFGLGALILGSGDSKSPDLKALYRYTAKTHFLTKAETEFYNVLAQAVGNQYRIFAQVHLSSILDEKIKGQDWRAARAHINRKSVDFLLCDQKGLAPKLAIELDDSLHDREDRKVRDGEVERILEEAGLPLLRIRNWNSITSVLLVEHIKKAVVSDAT